MIKYSEQIAFLELGIPKCLIEELIIYHGSSAIRYSYEHIEAHIGDVDSCYLCSIGWNG